MTSMSNAGRLVALSVLAFPLGAVAASNALSFTAHSLNLSSGDSVGLLALGSAGDAYIVGTVTDSSGVARAQITKTDSAGKVVASYRFGVRASVSAICVDHKGAVIVAGQGYEADFPSATFFGTATASPVAFVAKLDSALAGITASAVIGGNRATAPAMATTAAESVSVDASDNIYIGGLTTATDFPATTGAYATTSSGDGFLAELSSGLNKIVFATYYDIALKSLVVDGSGAIVGAGNYGYTVGSLWLEKHGETGTVVKFAAGGGSVLWTEGLAALGEVSGGIASLALDTSGDVVLVGSPVAMVQYDDQQIVARRKSADAPELCRDGPGFVAKLSSASGAPVLFTGYSCGVNAVAVDSADTIWITGTTYTGSYLAALSSDGSSVLASYTASVTANPAYNNTVLGLLGQVVALTPAGYPVVLGTEGFLMLSNNGGGPSLLGGVANAAGSAASGLIAPAEIVSFYGSGLGPAVPLDAQIVNGVVQSTLGGYQLLFGGVAAPLLYIGANQINAIVPNEVSGQDSVSVTLVTPAGSFPLADLYIRPSEPEIFHDPVSGYAIAINQDGTLNSSTNPAHAGWAVSIWATGAGAPGNLGFPPDGTIEPTQLDLLRHPALPVSMIANNDSLEVDYAGDSPGEVFGLTQVNFRLPQSLAPYTNSLSVNLQVGAAIGAPVPVYVAP